MRLRKKGENEENKEIEDEDDDKGVTNEKE